MKRIAHILMVSALLILVFAQCESPALKGAKIYMDRGQFEEAKEQLLSALEGDPENPEIHYLLGKIYKQEKDYAKMNEHFDKCTSLNPKPQQLLDIEMERNRAFNQHFNDAVRVLNASIDEADIDKRQSMLKESIENLKTALAVEDNTRGMEALGTAYFNLGDTENAETYYKKALEKEPTLHNSLVQLGILKYNQALDNNDDVELFKESQKYLEAFVTNYPEEKADVPELGYCYEMTGERDKAIAYYDGVIKENPDNVNALIQYGVVLFNSDKADQAMEVFKQALALDPTNIQVLKNIAQPLFHKVYEKIKDQQDTKEEWQNVLTYMKQLSDLEPNNPDTWEYLAVIYIRLGMQDESNAAMERAKELRK